MQPQSRRAAENRRREENRPHENQLHTDEKTKEMWLISDTAILAV